MTGTGETVTQVQTDNLEKLKEQIEKDIKARKDLEKLSKQIEIKVTPEGLRIELIEDKAGTFFEIGSAKLSASGQELLALLGTTLKEYPNSLLIEGHTDSTPYSSDVSYSNWDLSADRANSARRLLQQDGVRQNQVTQVRGYADMMPRVKNNPADPSNRRISILVKNDTEDVPLFNANGVVKGSTPLPSDIGKPDAPTPAAKPAGKGGEAAKPAAAANGPKASAPEAAKPAAPAPAKSAGPSPAALTPAAAVKPSLIDRIKAMLPGKKN
jgi:chemotaxis protein MotB